MSKKHKGLKVLLLDIETSPLLGQIWGIWDQNLGLNQIAKEWFVLSWSAKWYEDPSGNVYGPHKDVMYADQSNTKDIENDKDILVKIWKLMDSADIVVGQNSKRFDVKKLNARFIQHGMQPPSSFRQIDTLQLAKKYFSFTSNKLEWMTEKLCVKYKKLKHNKFSGFTLWSECLKGNPEAWQEMQKYNKYDVLSLEELLHRLLPWDNSINFNVYHDGTEHICRCGSTELIRKGYAYTNTAKYQRYKCKNCGAESRDNKNMLDKDKKSFLKRGTNR